MRDFATYLEHKILSFKYIVNAEKYFGLFEIHKCKYKKNEAIKRCGAQRSFDLFYENKTDGNIKNELY